MSRVSRALLIAHELLRGAQGYVSAWFGAPPPPGFLIGSYTGAGVGLSTSDAVNPFDPSGKLVTGVQFGTASPRPGVGRRWAPLRSGDRSEAPIRRHGLLRDRHG